MCRGIHFWGRVAVDQIFMPLMFGGANAYRHELGENVVRSLWR